MKKILFALLVLNSVSAMANDASKMCYVGKTKGTLVENTKKLSSYAEIGGARGKAIPSQVCEYDLAGHKSQSVRWTPVPSDPTSKNYDSRRR